MPWLSEYAAETRGSHVVRRDGVESVPRGAESGITHVERLLVSSRLHGGLCNKLYSCPGWDQFSGSVVPQKLGMQGAQEDETLVRRVVASGGEVHG